MDEMRFPTHYTKIIQSFLSNRKITFRYNQITQTKNLTKGCPQGSPLSPILWNIALNPLLNSFIIENAYIHAYADDITIICTGSDTQQLHHTLQTSLTLIHNWSTQNHLVINSKKTNIIHFHKKTLETPILLNNEQIEIVNKVKILGLTMENHTHKNKINFNTHIQNIITKTIKIKNTLFNFCKNTYGINTQKRKNVGKEMVKFVS